MKKLAIAVTLLLTLPGCALASLPIFAKPASVATAGHAAEVGLPGH